MEYESTILKRLIDTYGVVGNPRYISEIIKEFIVRGKELYPQLFTYQSDWLAHIDEFGLNPSYTVSYTGQSIYAPNTLEKPVKSAILKGQTTDTIIDFTESFTIQNTVKDFNFLFSPKLNKKYMLTLELTDVAPRNGESDYIAIRGVKEDGSYDELTRLTQSYANGIYEIPCEFTKNYSNFRIGVAFKATIVNMKLRGDLISVKMPVLTTSNEDGTKTNILSTPEDLELRGIGDVQDTLDCLTGEVTERIGEFILDVNTNIIKYQDVEGFNTTGYYVNLPSNFIPNTTNFICNSLPKGIPDKIQPNMDPADEEGIVVNAGHIKFRVSNEKGTNVTDFKKYLEVNPIKLIIPLVEKSIKTVDLTILDQNGQNVKQLMSFNGGTHFNTGSLEGSLIPSVSVTVETDLEETLKVCSLEGNTI